MKKKSVCMMLALFLTLSLFSFASLSAYADTQTFSDVGANGIAITMVTDGHCTAAQSTAGDEAMVSLTPDAGYIIDTISVTETNTGSTLASLDGDGYVSTPNDDYSIMLSGWPDAAVLFPPDVDVTITVTTAEAVTANYDANGGVKGPMWQDTRIIRKGQTEDFSISDDLVSPPEGKEYDGVTANGVRVGPTDPYTYNDNVTVVYQWKNPGEDTAPKCTVTFDPNGGTTGPRWEDTLEIGNGTGSTVTVRDDYDILPPEGKTFKALEVEGTEYAPGEAFPVEGKDALTARFIWEDDDDPGTGGSEPGTGGSEPGTGGSEPGTGGSEPGTGGSEPGTGGSEPGTGGSEPGTGGSDPGTGGSEPGTGGNGSGTGGSGSGAKRPTTVPKTGDESRIGLWCAFLSLSTLGGCALLAFRRLRVRGR